MIGWGPFGLGPAVRPPDRPDGKKCPHCKRNYRQLELRKGKRRCPYCGVAIKEGRTSKESRP